jgi:hypothetical protein
MGRSVLADPEPRCLGDSEEEFSGKGLCSLEK